jgi:carbon monoxide dehydrogenase subunit G
VPRQTFMHRVLAPAEPARVWKGLQRPESWGRIGGVRNVEHPTFDEAGDITGYRFTVELGGNSHFGVARRSGATPGSRVSMTIDTDLLGGEIDVELEAAGDQTAVTVAMTVESKGFVTAMLFPVITGAIASGFNEEVTRFAKGLIEDPISPES